MLSLIRDLMVDAIHLNIFSFGFGLRIDWDDILSFGQRVDWDDILSFGQRVDLDDIMMLWKWIVFGKIFSHTPFDMMLNRFTDLIFAIA